MSFTDVTIFKIVQDPKPVKKVFASSLEEADERNKNAKSFQNSKNADSFQNTVDPLRKITAGDPNLVANSEHGELLQTVTEAIAKLNNFNSLETANTLGYFFNIFD